MTDNTRRVLMIAALFLVLGALWVAPLADTLNSMARWIQLHPIAGSLLYLIVFPICVVFLVPGSWIAMFGGYVFGLPVGILLASLGASLGAYAAFLNGRTLARRLVSKRMEASPRLHALDRAVAEQTFFVVFLTRIALVIPYNLLNYMYSLTSIRSLAYLVPTILGIVPAMSLFVFLGTQAKSAEQILSGELQGGSIGVIVLVVSSIAVLLVAVILQRAARNLLRQSMDRPEN